VLYLKLKLQKFDIHIVIGTISLQILSYVSQAAVSPRVNQQHSNLLQMWDDYDYITEDLGI
jgi:uncharacterized protein YutD